MSDVYVHVSSVLSEVDLTEKEVLTAFRENPLKPFELVRDLVEYLGFERIRNVKFEDAFFNGRNYRNRILGRIRRGQSLREDNPFWETLLYFYL